MYFHSLWLIRCVFARGLGLRFGGYDNIEIDLGVISPKNCPKRGVDRQFQAKRVNIKSQYIAKYKHDQRETGVRTIKHKSRVVRYDVITNPRWRTAAILKIENTQ